MNTSPSDFSNTQLSRSEIELRAFQIWCQQGCPPYGRDVDNWIEAERQLASERGAQAAQDPGPSTTAPAKPVIPLEEDVPVLSDSPHAALSDRAPLATAVEDQLTDPGRPNPRRSKTNVEL